MWKLIIGMIWSFTTAVSWNRISLSDTPDQAHSLRYAEKLKVFPISEITGKEPKAPRLRLVHTIYWLDACKSTSPTLWGKSLIKIYIVRRCYRTLIKCGDGGGWFWGCWWIREQRWGPMGLCIRQRHRQCCCTTMKVGWWRGLCWRSWRGFTIGRPDWSQEWRKMCCGQVVGIYSGCGVNRSSRLTPHTGVHSDMTGDHLITGDISPHLWTIYWVGCRGRARWWDCGIRTWYMNLRSRWRICVN